MIFLIAVTILVVIIVFSLLLWYYIEYSPINADEFEHEEQELEESEPIPTMHARCQNATSCGGDLICDVHCHRCKKQIGGDCSSDIDCESNLRCQDWRCVNNLQEILLDSSNYESNYESNHKSNHESNHESNGMLLESPVSEHKPREKSVKWADEVDEVD